MAHVAAERIRAAGVAKVDRAADLLRVIPTMSAGFDRLIACEDAAAQAESGYHMLRYAAWIEQKEAR